MNTRHAQLILAILREGSFTAAAKALFITQPTLSQTVKQIEAQLGEAIFTRGHAPAQLTPAGELYVQAARRMLQIEAQLAEGLSALHGHTQGTLCLGLPLQRADELLPQILPDFYAACPDVTITALSAPAPELERLLCSGELDMALISSPDSHPRLTYQLIASDEIVLLAGRRTALAQRIPSGSTISLCECAAERFILPADGLPLRQAYDALLQSQGVAPHAVMQCDDAQCAKRVCAACSLVMLSPFISLLSDSAAMQQLAHYRLTDAFLPPLRMAYAREMPPSPYAQKLFTLMSNRFRAMTAYRA